MVPGSSLTDEVIAIADDAGIETGIILSFIGTVSEVLLRNPRDTTTLPIEAEHEFASYVDTTVLQRKMEIISIEGNIAKYNGETFLNLHGVFSEAGGNLRGGHIFRATIWSQAEVFIQEIVGARFVRYLDEEVTGIPQIRLIR
jgi:predicted DNA-binding protein with PD1-like motif